MNKFNYESLSTNNGLLQYNEEKPKNKFEGYFDFDENFLKYKNKINVEVINISIGFIFFICQLVEVKDNTKKNSIGIPTNFKKKLLLKIKN